MKIEIDSLSYDELVELNLKIVEKLKILDSMHSYKLMMQFSPGDQVYFEAPGRGKQYGTLTRYNKKTVTVITESGQKWNVSPHLLSKIIKLKKNENGKGKIIDFHKKRTPKVNG